MRYYLNTYSSNIQQGFDVPINEMVMSPMFFLAR